MASKRKLVRWIIGIVLVFALSIAAMFGYALYEERGNPFMPMKNWPILEAATNDSTSRVRVIVANDVPVNLPSDGLQYWECDLAADPQNSDRLFAASLVHTQASVVPGLPGRLANVAGFYSHDKGKSWSRAFYHVADTANPDSSKRESYFDPTVCWGRDDSVHFAVMYSKGIDLKKASGKGDRVDFWRSDNAGKNWKQRTGIDRFLDRPFTVVDTTTGSKGGRQYTIAQHEDVVFVSNQEKGAEVGEGKTVTRLSNPRPANPVVLRDGSVLMVVEDFNPKWMGHIRPDTARQIHTFRCVDGEQFEAGPQVNTQWSHDSLNNAARPTYSMFPRLGTNPEANKFVDHVYCVWAGKRSLLENGPDGERIFLSVSRDGGKSWDQPVAISEQPLGANPNEDFLTAIPSVAVNRNGVVALSWYDRRGLPLSEAHGKLDGWNVRTRISVDGGTSWLSSVQLNQKPSKGEFDLGHTAGLTAAADGRFHSMWIDSRDGTRQLRTASFGVE